MNFQIFSDYKPTGDQPQAIEKLSNGIFNGEKYQTLLGVTGSGKTFTVANVIQNVEKPTLVLAITKLWQHNCIPNSNNFFQTIQLNILFPITIIISPKHLFRNRNLYRKRFIHQ